MLTRLLTRVDQNTAENFSIKVHIWYKTKQCLPSKIMSCVLFGQFTFWLDYITAITAEWKVWFSWMSFLLMIYNIYTNTYTVYVLHTYILYAGCSKFTTCCNKLSKTDTESQSMTVVNSLVTLVIIPCIRVKRVFERSECFQHQRCQTMSFAIKLPLSLATHCSL